MEGYRVDEWLPTTNKTQQSHTLSTLIQTTKESDRERQRLRADKKENRGNYKRRDYMNQNQLKHKKQKAEI